MKLGIHQLVWFNTWDETKLDYLDLIKDIGFDAMDLLVRSVPEELIPKIRQRAARIGLKLVGISSLPSGWEILSDDSEQRLQAIEYLKSLVRKTHLVGSDFYGGVIHSPLGKLVGRPASEVEMNRAMEAMKILARYAAGFDIDIGIEIVNRYETYLLNTVDAGLRFIDSVGEDNLGLILDTYHMNVEEKDIVHVMRTAGKKILHIHLSENDRGIPGSGHVDWHGLFKLLGEKRYDRVASIESFSSRIPEIGGATCLWRKIFDDPKEFAISGCKFCRSLMEKYGA
ncbi:MAG: sugar phosphate isomerase/epimerase family protein [Syntrophales bacterium]